MTHERRRNVRVPVDFFVQVEQGGYTMLWPALDLSLGGMYVITGDDHGAIDGRNPVSLEFQLEEGQGLALRARIAYVDDRRGVRGMALSFEPLDEAVNEALRAFIERKEGLRRA